MPLPEESTSVGSNVLWITMRRSMSGPTFTGQLRWILLRFLSSSFSVKISVCLQGWKNCQSRKIWTGVYLSVRGSGVKHPCMNERSHISKKLAPVNCASSFVGEKVLEDGDGCWKSWHSEADCQIRGPQGYGRPIWASAAGPRQSHQGKIRMIFLLRAAAIMTHSSIYPHLNAASLLYRMKKLSRSSSMLRKSQLGLTHSRRHVGPAKDGIWASTYGYVKEIQDPNRVKYYRRNDQSMQAFVICTEKYY